MIAVEKLKREIDYLKNNKYTTRAEEKQEILDEVENLLDEKINLETQIYYLQKKISILENILKVYDINPKIVNEPGIEFILINAVSKGFTMPKMTDTEKDKFMVVSNYISSLPDQIKDDYLNFLQEWNFKKFLTYAR